MRQHLENDDKFWFRNGNNEKFLHIPKWELSNNILLKA